MRAFVTGGSGFIGRHVIRKLVARGDDVVALARSARSASALEALGARVVIGDVADRESLSEGLRGSDVVFHLAGWYEFGVHDVARLEAVNVEGARNVLELAWGLGVPKIVHTSSIAVFDDTRGCIADEDYRCSGSFLTAYNRSKWKAHYEVALPLIEQGAPIVIVQPCGVYGPGDHSIIGELLWVFRHGLMLAVPGPDTIISFVHVEDVADGIILAGDRGRVGESYLLGGPNLTFAEVMALWAEVTGKRAPPVAIPSGFLHRFAPLMGWVERVIPLPQMLRKEAICTLGASYAATSEKAIRELGWKPRPLRVGMKETFDAPANASRPPRRFTRRQRQAAGLVLAAMLVVAMASVIARRRGEAGGR